MGRGISPAFMFILLMGIVSLLADMAHEGARGVLGDYLSLLGASAATVGFVAGLGECMGYALRMFTGMLADRTRLYWPMTIGGYCANMLAIPLLALVPEGGWLAAAGLILAERIGKAVRQPAKNTLLSFAASREGVGRSFAIQEFLDQVGAFLGPVLLFAIMAGRGGTPGLDTYALCFACLGIPGLMALVVLLAARRRFPDPAAFEPPAVRTSAARRCSRSFLLYLAASSLLAFAFVDFPLVTLHVARTGILGGAELPLLYALAMLADACAALVFGWLYDRQGYRALVPAALVGALFPVFIFWTDSLWGVAVGACLWGMGMGAQESVMKAVVVSLSTREQRACRFGIFEACFGVSWFLGSWCLGWLYEADLRVMVLCSLMFQLLACALFLRLAIVAQARR